eukprot:s5_g36.t1
MKKGFLENVKKALYPGGDAKTAAEALKSTDLEQLAQLSESEIMERMAEMSPEEKSLTPGECGSEWLSTAGMNDLQSLLEGAASKTEKQSEPQRPQSDDRRVVEYKLEAIEDGHILQIHVPELESMKGDLDVTAESATVVFPHSLKPLQVKLPTAVIPKKVKAKCLTFKEPVARNGALLSRRLGCVGSLARALRPGLCVWQLASGLSEAAWGLLNSSVDSATGKPRNFAGIYLYGSLPFKGNGTCKDVEAGPPGPPHHPPGYMLRPAWPPGPPGPPGHPGHAPPEAPRYDPYAYRGNEVPPPPGMDVGKGRKAGSSGTEAEASEARMNLRIEDDQIPRQYFKRGGYGGGRLAEPAAAPLAVQFNSIPGYVYKGAEMKEDGQDGFAR